MSECVLFSLFWGGACFWQKISDDVVTTDQPFHAHRLPPRHLRRVRASAVQARSTHLLCRTQEQHSSKRSRRRPSTLPSPVFLDKSRLIPNISSVLRRQARFTDLRLYLFLSSVYPSRPSTHAHMYSPLYLFCLSYVCQCRPVRFFLDTRLMSRSFVRFFVIVVYDHTVCCPIYMLHYY